MFNKNQLLSVASFVVSTALAVTSHSETSFPEILKSLTSDHKNIVTDIPELTALNQTESIEQARALLANKTISDAVSIMNSAAFDQKQILNLIREKQITFVIVPGVLGEFINTRAFEEIFSRASTYKNTWNSLVRLSNATDERFDLQKNGLKTELLSDLVNAASIDDANGRPLIKVVILKTFLGSLESVGSNAEQAKIFNRRLEKYVKLSQDKNLVLLGYSRGTPLALEMLVQAKAEKLSYLKSVKTLVSYAGVVMGSTLADVTEDENSESGRLYKAAMLLYNSLKLSKTMLDRPMRMADNSAAISKFMFALGTNSKFDPEAFLSNTRSGDFKTVAALIAQVTTQLGLSSLYDFNGHVERVKLFIKKVITAADELKTSSRTAWWKSNTLPKDIQYYSIAAAMVDPDKGSLEKSIFESLEGYSNSLDDKSLLANMRSYEKLTGVSLNDSQVAVHQSLFLPGLISKLNPMNMGLKVKALGLLETHHWGVSLQVVNKMKDGRLNPFPREKVLLALAAYLNQ